MRVTTIHAGSAAATARYYTRYLTQAPGEEPGRWFGSQAEELGLSGVVSTAQLESLLSGCDPSTGASLGRALTDRCLMNGKVVKAVAGFDATLSAPKSLSVWWALTGDPGLAECHDVAVRAVVAELERFGATTRVRAVGGRLHPDTRGLTVAVFRQTTSRVDDPQLHTHVVISAKVQTKDGRWLALDARMLKRHQRALGGLYQSVLRAELTHRYGVGFAQIVNGQAEIAGVPVVLLERFSKRAAEVDRALRGKLAGFYAREARDPTRFERAALEREAAADTRAHKTGIGVPDLRTRWLSEAAELGVTAHSLTAAITAARPVEIEPALTVESVVETLSSGSSAWHRMDVLRSLCDRVRPRRGVGGERWAVLLDRAVDRVLEHCVDLDPGGGDGGRRRSDGRSVWIEPVADHYTSEVVLAQEEHILAWAIAAQTDDPAPSSTVRPGRLDVLQADAAAAAAGHDRLVVIVGPAGAGKTTMLAAAVDDLHDRHRPVFGLAPTAKAARVLERDTGLMADTVAKLLHEWGRPDGPDRYWQLPPSTTLVVDEAGMLDTNDLCRLVELAEGERWRLVLVGDPRQLQAVGRGGMFAELCATSRHIALERIHRFTNQWEAAASLQLRHGDPGALDAYLARDRIAAGPLFEHLDTIARYWLERHTRGETTAITTTRNEHVDAINQTIQQYRLERGDLDPHPTAVTADGAVYVGDVIATRRNQRQLRARDGHGVCNRDLWTVTGISTHGDLTVTHNNGHGDVTLPAGYVSEHVRLGYAATEPGNQSGTETASITLASTATTARGLYVAMTRGQQENLVLVVTDGHDLGVARDVLEVVLATDRVDIPATTQRRALAHHERRPVLQPRCAIPDWFAELRAGAAAECTAAAVALKRSEAKRGLLQEAIAEARERLATADQACAPYDTVVDTARRAVAAAREIRQVADARLSESGWLHRRARRAELTIASADLGLAETELASANQQAEPTNQQRAQARRNLSDARDAFKAHNMWDRWNFHPERLREAEARLDVLNTWGRWAQGHPVDRGHLADAVEALNHSPDATTDGSRALADVVSRWAHQQGIDIRPPTTPTIERVDLGIEIGY